MTLDSTRLNACALALALVGSASLSQAQEVKRSEGRYFLEMSEIFFEADAFDTLVGHTAPADDITNVTPVISKLSDPDPETPKITFGLTRPSGAKYELSFLQFDNKDSLFPPDFADDSLRASTTFLPPGVQFEHQEIPVPGANPVTAGAPNVGTILAHRSSVDFKTVAFKYRNTIHENKRGQLQWSAGIRYAQLEHGVQSALGFLIEPRRPIEIDTGMTQIRIGGDPNQQDIAIFTAESSVQGVGPQLGLHGDWWLDQKKKRLSLRAELEVAYLPESTNGNYGLNLVDVSSVSDNRSFNFGAVAPRIPGLTDTFQGPFRGGVAHGDYTDGLLMAEGTLGLRYHFSDHVALGLNGWFLRWNDVLTANTILAETTPNITFGVIPAPQGNTPDPDVQGAETFILVPRFEQREDVTFSGVSVSLDFTF
ncbi:MAG: hypothetical protein AAF533_27800 [Acidobacteriota bacterium]